MSPLLSLSPVGRLKDPQIRSFFVSRQKRGKAEDVQRKVGVVLLNGQKLELNCDVKAVCKDVLDMVVAHVGLVEHHLFGLAYLRGTERVSSLPQVLHFKHLF